MIENKRVLPNICLCLHCIGHDADPEPKAHRELFLRPEEVDALFASLRSEGYRFALPGDATEKSSPVCSVTFDDGYYNNRHFLATAERYHIPFILFVTSYNVLHRIPFMWDVWESTRTGRWPISSANYRKLYESIGPGERALLSNDTHRPFTAEELGAFAAHPLVHLAPHGHTHQPMVGRYLKGMDGEIDDNLAFLSQYGNTLLEDFSLPCGFYTGYLKRRLLDRFRRIYTIDGGGFYATEGIIHRIPIISPEYGGDPRDQIRRSFGAKARLLRKVLNFRYSNRLLCRV
jgi:peptidoglycan/xylan/chitin deacetylase (PgdA/CDA1 family)